jgi:hypothetical protein
MKEAPPQPLKGSGYRYAPYLNSFFNFVERSNSQGDFELPCELHFHILNSLKSCFNEKYN